MFFLRLIREQLSGPLGFKRLINKGEMLNYVIIFAPFNNGLSDSYVFSQLVVYVVYSVRRKNYITILVARC